MARAFDFFVFGFPRPSSVLQKIYSDYYKSQSSESVDDIETRSIWNIVIKRIPRGNCATWISGNAPPSPKSLTVLGTNPDRAPYGGGSLLTVATA